MVDWFLIAEIIPIILHYPQLEKHCYFFFRFASNLTSYTYFKHILSELLLSFNGAIFDPYDRYFDSNNGSDNYLKQLLYLMLPSTLMPYYPVLIKSIMQLGYNLKMSEAGWSCPGTCGDSASFSMPEMLKHHTLNKQTKTILSPNYKKISVLIKNRSHFLFIVANNVTAIGWTSVTKVF